MPITEQSLVDAELPTIADMIREFSLAFKRPVNDRVVPLSEEERLLLGKLLFEGAVEYVTKGLGLRICVDRPQLMTNAIFDSGFTIINEPEEALELEVNPHVRYDPIESADGLADVNVIVNFNSSLHGFDLYALTREVHESNMSKLDICDCCGGNGWSGGVRPADPELCDACECCSGTGTMPIINGVTPGYRNWTVEGDPGSYPEVRFDPSKPIGKILKGPNYRPPNLQKLLRYDESMCPDHTASDADPKVCRYCGVHVDSFRPDEEGRP